jgi:hypothetical protein
MYVGCNGATIVYACCIIVRARICGKMLFLSLGNTKMELKSAYGNGKGLMSKFV